MNGQPIYRALPTLRAMVGDASLRPGDKSIAAYRDSLAALSPSHRDAMALILQDYLSAMLQHLRSESVLDYDVPPPKTDDWEALALAWRPDRDPWETLLSAAERLEANARGLARGQGGTRDLIRG